MTLRTEHFDYADGDAACEGYLAYPLDEGRRPCVLVAHQWAGLSDHERGAAEHFAEASYVGFAIDVYGKGNRGQPMADNSHLMGPWLADRAALRRRLLAAVAAAKAHPRVDPTRIAIIGYCFGGLCALDAARSGSADVKGAVSIHGIFPPPDIGPQADITAKVLVLHGWDDPMAPPESVLGLAREMSAAKADWQLHAYGNTLHAFTAPGANAPERGLQYNADADRRSRAAMLAFLAEVLA
jgi:dienelactone hydrolase